MKVEETVKQSDNEDDSARGKTMEGSDNEVEDDDNSAGGDGEASITDESECDYIIYTVRDPSSQEVVAVFIQTKTTLHPNFKHAVAQVSPSTFSLTIGQVHYYRAA